MAGCGETTTSKLIKLNELTPPTSFMSYFEKVKSDSMAVATSSHALHASTVIERMVDTCVKPSRSSRTTM
jgi:hypothetical protein